jgi:hypothetical protein
MAGKFSTPRTSPITEAPSQHQPAPYKPRKPHKNSNGPRISTLIFYTAYIMLIVFFVMGMRVKLTDLEQQLKDYESAQPEPCSRLVFEELFSEPDWEVLYSLAQIPDTAFEGKEQYAAYMETLVGDQVLTYQEESQSDEDIRIYQVLAGDRYIGSFRIKSAPTETSIAWSFDSLSLSTEYKESVHIQKLSTHTVYINGVPLDDSYTVRTISVCDDAYLPRGVYNVWLHTQHVTGLMLTPEVTAVDKTGQAVDVTYDPITNTYITSDSIFLSTEEEETAALDALKTFVHYKVNRYNPLDISDRFDIESPFFVASEEDIWESSNLAPEFSNEQITGFYRCSKNVFCIWVELDAYVHRINGTLKEYNMVKSMLFQKKGNSWLCIGISDLDQALLDTQVRVTFMNQDIRLSSELYSENITTLQTPLLGTGDEGTLTGWVCSETGMVFIPDSNGLVTLPEGMILRPMVLYAQFNNTNSEVNE